MAEQGGSSLGVVFVVSALTSLVVSISIGYGVQNGLIDFGADVEVPELAGMSDDAARGMLESRGLRLVGRGERHHEEADPGVVIEQQPAAGSAVPRGSEVSVVLSLGPDEIEVPDVLGLSVEPARARLVNAGLEPSEIVREGGEGTPGTVSSTSPAAGQRVARGTSVSLQVVPARRTITVPDWSGQPARQVREAIVAAGLVVGRQRTGFDGDRPPYIVLRHTPAAGAEVDPGTEVEIVVNEE